MQFVPDPGSLIADFPNVPLQEAIDTMLAIGSSIPLGFQSVDLSTPESDIPEAQKLTLYNFTLFNGSVRSVGAFNKDKN